MTYWENKNVLITGISGFVGAHLSKKLIEGGANIIGIEQDFKPITTLSLLGLDKKVTLVMGGVENFNLLLRALSDYEIDTVFHLAASTIVGKAIISPISTFQTNIIGTANVLEACRFNGNVERIVVASSDKSYGNSDELPYLENMPLNASNIYDVSKACADKIAYSYFNSYNLPIAVTRCSNIFGGGDLNFSRIIPGTIKSVFSNEEPIIRSDGRPIRDYMYIDDAVSAYITLAENLDKVKGRAFNFGTGKPVSVLELVNKIISISGKDIKPKVLNTAKGEIYRQYVSSENAKTILEWEAKHELDAALNETISWYTNFLKR